MLRFVSPQVLFTAAAVSRAWKAAVDCELAGSIQRLSMNGEPDPHDLRSLVTKLSNLSSLDVSRISPWSQQAFFDSFQPSCQRVLDHVSVSGLSQPQALEDLVVTYPQVMPHSEKEVYRGAWVGGWVGVGVLNVDSSSAPP